MSTIDAVAEAIYETNRKVYTWLPPWTKATTYHRHLFADMADAAIAAINQPDTDLGQRYSDRVTHDRPLTDADQQLIRELLDGITWQQRSEATEAELERFEPWCSCGTRKGQRADGTLICLADMDHGDRLPTHWTKRP